MTCVAATDKMRITRKVFSSKNLINTIEKKAFCEGYQAAQKEFAKNITWKRGEKINESDIKEVEATFGVSLPDDYKSIVVFSFTCTASKQG